jgi:glycosyltransferase involved in cell wall biosynthesis
MTESTNSPFWSVMIPTYNPRPQCLEQTLRSVLAQDPGCVEMQIMVIDDASSEIDTESIVRAVGGDRIQFHRSEKNRGLAGSWNHCIECARGSWVHILHQDDFVLAGFYECIKTTALNHPDVQFIATRSYFVDRVGIIEGVTPRVQTLEKGGHSISDFYYANPIQCPGVVVQRDFYLQNGGFRADLNYTLDVELWARVIDQKGGVVLPDILAAFRVSGKSESSRLLRSADAFNDRIRLSLLFAERYSDFNFRRARREMCWEALLKARQFRQAGDLDSAAAYLTFWKKNATVNQKCCRTVSSIARVGLY